MIPMRRTPLSQLASVSAGQSAPKDNEFSESGVPFVRAGSLDALLSGKSESELELVNEKTAKLRKLKTYPEGTILFAKSGMSATKDRVYVLQNPAHVVSHLATLIPKEGAHVDYLRLALKRFPPSSLIKDPAYPAIGLGDIENFEIPVPEKFDDQIRIAHLLGKVEGLIAPRKQHLQQLDDLLKSVFLEMFGDPVRNEKGWEPTTIGDSVEIQSGQVDPRELPYSEMRHVGGANIESQSGNFIELKQAKYESLISGKYLFDSAYILYSKIRPYLNKVAKPDFQGICSADIYPIKPINGLLNRDFLRMLLMSKAFLNYTANNSDRANIPKINRKALVAFGFNRPPIDLQNQFAAIVERVESIKSRYQRSLADLEALYGTLSQKAFKGELDLSRVPLQGTTSEESKPIPLELPPTEITINLPDISALLDAVQGPVRQQDILRYWLDAYRAQLGNAPFSAPLYMTAAHTKLAEMHPDGDFELGSDDYDHIKKWVFDALASGGLQQSRNITGHDDNGEPVFGNVIELKAVQA